jgi:predicted ribosome quality control (RQC) complex YloA/Tae2 family protein
MHSEPRTPPPADAAEQVALMLRVLRRHQARLARKREAVLGDLAEARRGDEHRRAGEALLAYLHQVPRRAARVTLPDPADPERTIEIELDVALAPQANAARLFKRAAKAARGLAEIPPRLRAVEAEIARIDDLARELEAAAGEDVTASARARVMARALDALPPALRRQAPEPRAATPRAAAATAIHVPAPPRRHPPAVPARLVPRRLRTLEGWDVLIGRTSEGNDHLTHHLARPEDYWFHVHGASGSHVVLRRGKGKNEPSKRTLEEVASWTAFYSQARNAGKVPVIWTLKKYVRRPRKAPPGLVVCEREKTIMARPVEPPRSALADEATDGGAAE